MKKYCKYCGNLVEECTCDKDKVQEPIKEETKKKDDFFVDGIKERMGFQTASSKTDVFELKKKIVPDCVIADTGEVSIRQYHIAEMRSLLKGMFSHGRLQVTNKRVLFRGAGISLLGTTELQYEFAINEIAGIELRRDHRISPFNLAIGIVIASLIMNMFGSMFGTFAGVSDFFASIFSLALSIIAILMFFGIKKKFYIKLAALSMAAGALSSVAFDLKFGIIPISNGTMYNILETILLVLFIFNLIVISFIPNMVIAIKTKSASSPIEIRRKESNGIMAFLLNMSNKEYTGFSDVMPGKDFEKARRELGAMIKEINLEGQMAVEKWKED